MSLILKVLKFKIGICYYVIVIVYNFIGIFSIKVLLNGVLVDVIVLFFLQLICDGDDYINDLNYMFVNILKVIWKCEDLEVGFFKVEIVFGFQFGDIDVMNFRSLLVD